MLIPKQPLLLRLTPKPHNQEFGVIGRVVSYEIEKNRSSRRGVWYKRIVVVLIGAVLPSIALNLSRRWTGSADSGLMVYLVGGWVLFVAVPVGFLIAGYGGRLSRPDETPDQDSEPPRKSPQ